MHFRSATWRSYFSLAAIATRRTTVCLDFWDQMRMVAHSPWAIKLGFVYRATRLLGYVITTRAAEGAVTRDVGEWQEDVLDPRSYWRNTSAIFEHI